ncbi:hypothetical protein BDN67DRAFT_1010420 [Paxillus ammoniavirescens]|nr:hypothetical protein BDN67DRAFT_1010420 [Paxillus ammoniavirescens]
MPPTRTLTNTRTITIPSSERSRNPPSCGLMAKYITFTEESRNCWDITCCYQTSSPLLDTYLALLQNYHIANVVKFIERTNHPLNEHDWVITTLEHVHDEQQELLINVLHQLNFKDLTHDINRAHYSPYQGPLDHRNRVPPSSSPIRQREMPCNITPNRTRSSSTASSPICRPSTPHNVLTTISETIIFSRPLTHSGSSSSSIPRQGSGDSPEDSIDVDLTPEQAFGLSAEQVIVPLTMPRDKMPLVASHSPPLILDITLLATNAIVLGISASIVSAQHDNKTLFLKNTGKRPLGDPTEPPKPTSRANPYSIGISTELKNKGKTHLEEAADVPLPSATPEEEIEQDDNLYAQGFATRLTSPVDRLDGRPLSPAPIDVEPTTLFETTYPPRQPTAAFFDTMSEKPTELKVGTPTHFDGSPNDASQ